MAGQRAHLGGGYPRLRRARRACGLAAWVWLGSALAGCGLFGGGPEIESGSYEGPSVRVEPERGMWVLVAESPGAGWAWTVDAAREDFGRERVFVTGQRPNPLFRYAQGPTIQRLMTPTPAFQAIDVFVAVANFDEGPGDAPYRRAVSAEAAESARPDTEGQRRPSGDEGGNGGGGGSAP